MFDKPGNFPCCDRYYSLGSVRSGKLNKGWSLSLNVKLKAKFIVLSYKDAITSGAFMTVSIDSLP